MIISYHSVIFLGTIKIICIFQGPTYLLFCNKAEKDAWLYNLTVVSGGGLSQGTHYEQLVQKLMETDGDPSNFNVFFIIINIHLIIV